MSGGYKDDADTGGTFWYTGQGGQGKNNVQVGSTTRLYLLRKQTNHSAIMRLYLKHVGHACLAQPAATVASSYHNGRGISCLSFFKRRQLLLALLWPLWWVLWVCCWV
jgi:hypothetical protein